MSEQELSKKATSSSVVNLTTQKELNCVFTSNEALLSASKDKYEAKKHLVLDASDLNTSEKLQALDTCYHRHACEIWLSCIASGVLCFGVCMFLVCIQESSKESLLKHLQQFKPHSSPIINPVIQQLSSTST